MTKTNSPQEFKLSNGMPVILQKTDLPVAALYWWVSAGSADEKPSESGFAHFIEHMLFKDSDAKTSGQVSEGRLALSIEALGGEINAYTSFDQTVYHVTCAADHLHQVIREFGELAKHQRFLKTDFGREREVILEEVRKNEDSPGRKLFQGLLEQVYPSHPYGRPVIGYQKTLKKARVQDLEGFYRRNYISGKMGVILVAPFEEDGQSRTLAVLEKSFGSRVIPHTGFEEVPRKHDPLFQVRAKIQVGSFDVQCPMLSLAFRAPDLSHPDIPALDLLSSLLGMGELGRLYQRLFYQEELVTDVSGGLYVPKDPGVLFFQCELDETKKLQPILKCMNEEFLRIAREGPNPEEMERVITNAESEKLYSTQTVDGMAGRLGFLRFIMKNLSFDTQYLEELRAVTPQRIREVTSQYLEPRKLALSALVPKNHTKAECRGIEQEFMKLMNQGLAHVQTKKAPVTKVETKVLPEKITSPGGIRFFHRERPDSHVFSIHAVMLGGVRLEKVPGLSQLMALTWSKGTRDKDSRQIARIVEGRAASLDGFSGRNTLGIQMTGLARDFDGLSELVSEICNEPSFNGEEFEHSRRVALESLKSMEDHTAQLSSKLFLETLFGTHPYGRLTWGTVESVTQMNRENALETYREWFHPESLVISVVGNLSRQKLEKWMENLDRVLAGRTGSAPGLIKRPPKLPLKLPEPELKAPRWVDKKMGREQTHILTGGLGIRITDQERETLRLFQALMGGQSGRLFMELREKKSLAYSVASVGFEGMERGYLGTYIACAPEKQKEALEGIRVVYEEFVRKGPKKGEMERAREHLLGRRAMDLQSDSALAAYYSLENIYGLDLITPEELKKNLSRISGRDLQKVCRDYFVDAPRVTSVVG